MKRMYQYLKIPGVNLHYEGRDRDKSKFWDKGKWETFIDPLIPEETMGLPFLEIGSNSGLMLSLAEKKGFKPVIGIERQPDRVKTAELYKKSIEGNYKTLDQTMDANFDWLQLPRLGITLIANTHYYMSVNDFAEVINTLRNRTLYCIIVSATDSKKRSGKVGRKAYEVQGYFRDWSRVGLIRDIDPERDPSPRDGMYSIIYKSNLEAIDVEDMWGKVVERTSRRVGAVKNWGREGLLEGVEEFYKLVVSQVEFDMEKTLLYKHLRKRREKESVYIQLNEKKKLVDDIMNNGIKDLVYYDDRVHIVDGLSRLAIAMALGYKKIIAKKI